MSGSEPVYRRDRPRLPAGQRRRQIMEVASELIGDCGYWGLSTQDVADRCGLTVPGLLRHVGSKAGLLIAVLDHRDVEDARTLGTHLGLADQPAGAARIDLRGYCAALMRRDAGQPGIVRLYAVLEAESLAPDHPAHEYFQARQQRLLSQLTRWAGDLSAAPETLARLTLASLDGVRAQWLRTGTATDLAADWEAVAGTLFGGAAG